MSKADAKYGFAIPLTDKFMSQCKKLPDRVRVILQLYLILVDNSGLVEIIGPEEKLSYYDPI